MSALVSEMPNSLAALFMTDESVRAQNSSQIESISE